MPKAQAEACGYIRRFWIILDHRRLYFFYDYINRVIPGIIGVPLMQAFESPQSPKT